MSLITACLVLALVGAGVAGAAQPHRCGSMRVNVALYTKTFASGIGCKRARMLIRDAWLGRGKWHRGRANTSGYWLIHGFKCRTGNGVTRCVKGKRTAKGLYLLAQTY